jgi:hypothetical protein
MCVCSQPLRSALYSVHEQPAEGPEVGSALVFVSPVSHSGCADSAVLFHSLPSLACCLPVVTGPLSGSCVVAEINTSQHCGVTTALVRPRSLLSASCCAERQNRICVILQVVSYNRPSDPVGISNDELGRSGTAYYALHSLLRRLPPTAYTSSSYQTTRWHCTRTPSSRYPNA